jgi:hypothetical protein
MRSSVALVFILVLSASSLIMVKPEHALASITKPSVPEFTVELISSPPDSHFVNKTIEVTIKNQPFVPYYDDSSGWNISFYYDVRIKTNDVNWSDLYLIEDVPARSNDEYTILAYPSEQPVVENTYILGDRMRDFPPGTQVDFQVEAMIGYVHRVLNPNATNQLEMYPYVFTGEASGWSNIQTITVNDSTPSPTPSQLPSSAPSLTPTPSSSPTQQPTLEPTQSVSPTVVPILGIDPLPLILSIVALVTAFTAIAFSLVVYFRKIKQ